MVLLSVKLEHGSYGTWMNGYIPNGADVARYLEVFEELPTGHYDHFRAEDRTDVDVREAYCLLLCDVYKSFAPAAKEAGLTLLGGTPRVLEEHPLINALGCPGQDHLVLATKEPHGEDFFHLVKDKYGFEQADPVPCDIADNMGATNADGTLIRPLTAEQTFVASASILLQSYVEIITDPKLASERFFERLSLNTA